MPNTVIVRYSHITDIIVFIAMLSIAAAVGIALILEAGIEPAVAVSLAFTGCITTVVGHILLRKTQRLERLQAELATVRNASNANLQKAQPADISSSLPSTAPDSCKLRSAANRESVKTGQFGATDAGLPRPHVRTQKSSAASNPQVRAGRKSDIEHIIRRLEDDIKSGRKVQEGVSIARQQPPQAKVCQEKKSSVPREASKSLQPHQATSLPNKSLKSLQKPDAADKLAAIADALVREKLDVFLEPIHGLNDGQESHFEVSIRLHLADGDILDQDNYSEVARGAAWLPLIDAVKVSQAKKVALQLMRGGRNGTFISQINGESVAGQSFNDDLASVIGHDTLVAGRLVLSITQDDLRVFSSAQWAKVNRLRQLGFRFAVAEVNSLDMDFEMLAQCGFVFAKLDAQIFLEGLPAAQTLIPPTDVCQYLAGSGLTLIVDGLTDETQKAKVLGFGAVYGQGKLFGAPRPVKVKAADTRTKEEAVTQQSISR